MRVLRDPDGLALGTPGGSPFLQAGVDWAPQSIGSNGYIWGRMSGSPVLVQTNRGVFAIGSAWTQGVAENLAPYMASARTSSETVFGEVDSVNTSSGPQLLLVKKSPFSYSRSPLAQASEDHLGAPDQHGDLTRRHDGGGASRALRRRRLQRRRFAPVSGASRSRRKAQ